jgi:FSR family fosmidomycin resistance protein-like MFS transporter
MMFSIFVLAGTLSGLIAGYMSDRIGFRMIFIAAHGLMTPALIVLLYLPGAWVYAGSALAGFFTLATLPLGVVMAQALAPKGRSMVASLMMGFAYGLGGVVSPMVGKLADIFGIHQVLLWSATIPLLSVGIIVFFPDVPSDNGSGD